VVVGPPEAEEDFDEVRLLIFKGTRNSVKLTVYQSWLPDFPPTPPRGRDPAIQARENIIFLADQEVSRLRPPDNSICKRSLHPYTVRTGFQRLERCPCARPVPSGQVDIWSSSRNSRWIRLGVSLNRTMIENVVLILVYTWHSQDNRTTSQASILRRSSSRPVQGRILCRPSTHRPRPNHRPSESQSISSSFRPIHGRSR
jgi:hypothetical protein